MRTFGTRGPVNPEKNYVVQRTDEIVDFINRVKDGRYIVIFAPRQTGKTTFFQQAIDAILRHSCDAKTTFCGYIIYAKNYGIIEAFVTIEPFNLKIEKQYVHPT